MNARSIGLVLAVWSVLSGQACSEPAGRLDRIRETGRIILGFPDASTPFAFLDANAKPVGYTLEICEGVAQRIKEALGLPKLEVRHVAVVSATRIPLIANGTIDLECGTASNLVERHALVSFAPTTFIAQIVLIARKDAKVDVNDLASFRGKSISAQSGGETQRVVTRLSARDGLNIKVMGAVDTAETFLLMSSGRATGSVNDDALAHAVVASAHDPGAFKIGTKGLEFAPYGILEPKDDPAFKKVVDDAVVAMMTDGAVAQLYTKYFERPIPPRQINLNLPMNDILKRALAHPTDSGDPAAYE